MKAAPVVIFGAGGSAREVAWLCSADRAGAPLHTVAAFVDDAPRLQGTQVNGIPVLSLHEARVRHADASMLVAVGSPRTREEMVERARAAGFGFATAVHPRAEVSPWVEMGEGTVVCAGCIVTTNIRLGRQVQVNIACTISHDAVLEDYVTLAPGVHIAGTVTLGRGAYVGIGASIINGRPGRPLVIGEGAVVGAGAVVTKEVAPGTTVVGVPARAR